MITIKEYWGQYEFIAEIEPSSPIPKRSDWLNRWWIEIGYRDTEQKETVWTHAFEYDSGAMTLRRAIWKAHEAMWDCYTDLAMTTTKFKKGKR